MCSVYGEEKRRELYNKINTQTNQEKLREIEKVINKRKTNLTSRSKKTEHTTNYVNAQNNSSLSSILFLSNRTRT